MPLIHGQGITSPKMKPQAASRVVRPRTYSPKSIPLGMMRAIQNRLILQQRTYSPKTIQSGAMHATQQQIIHRQQAHRAHLIHLNRQARAGNIAGPAGFTGGGNTRAPASRSEADWIKTLLHVLGAPDTPANVNSLAAWIRHESTWTDQWGGALWTNNPLNTTQPASGATNWFNSIKKYPTAAVGIAATAATIINYPQILSALRSGNGICGGNLASNFSTWSGGGYSRVCLCLIYSVI